MQSPLSWGRNVTEAVIWRKMAAISAWISGSVFSRGGAEAGLCESAFSWSAAVAAVLDEGFDFDFLGGCEIWT